MIRYKWIVNFELLNRFSNTLAETHYSNTVHYILVKVKDNLEQHVTCQHHVNKSNMREDKRPWANHLSDNRDKNVCRALRVRKLRKTIQSISM